MTEQERFTSLWIAEARTTSKVLSRIPDGSSYKPDDRSRTAQEIAWQIVCEERMLIDAMETGNAAWAPPEMPPAMKDVAAAYEEQSRRMAERRRRHGVELPVRHRASPGTDHDVPAADGFDRAADLRAERRRALRARGTIDGHAFTCFRARPGCDGDRVGRRAASHRRSGDAWLHGC